MLGWAGVDIPLLVMLPVLLALSGFFSGSETALFGLNEAQRAALRRSGRLAGRAVEALLADQRMLLITLLLGNMTINVLYFISSSILIMRSGGGVMGEIALGVGSLLAVVLFGEVLPKLVANTDPPRFASLTGPALLAVHRLIAPIRAVLEGVVVDPLSRLTAPQSAPPRLSSEELTALVAVSGQAGVIDPDEQRLLHEVITLGHRRVREVMTPRVRIVAVPAEAHRADVVEALARSRSTSLPVYRGDLDEIVGMLPVQPYLLATATADRAAGSATVPARYVPEMARLDRLLVHFRETGTDQAIVVDEYGGTAGIVSLEDVVEELVGDIATGPQAGGGSPMLLAHGRWRVPGEMSVRDWAEAFGQRLVSPRVSTLGGLVVSRLGRGPRPGDVVELGNVRIEVEAVERARVLSAVVTLIDAGGEASP